MDLNRCHFGDCRDVLRRMIADGVRVNMCATSPPYWALRSYLDDGHEAKHLELGSEPTLAEYVANMVEVFGLVREVLTEDGTCWINWGDSYTSGDRSTYRSGASENKGQDIQNDMPRPATPPGLKPKDLCGVPWRCAFALQEAGWWLRQEIIWAKPNPMPESVTDRCTKSHEQVFLLAKSARYFFDATAIAEPSIHAGETIHTNGNDGMDAGYDGHRTREGFRRGVTVGANRNRRSVWTIPSQAFSMAHFATFPEALVEPMILAGTSAHGHCPECGKGWVRVVEQGFTAHDGETASLYETGSTANRLAKLRQAARERGEEYSSAKKTLGWEPSCAHNLPPVPGVVLDPFLGSGTVAKVAQSLGRNWLGIELNADYAKFQDNRITQYGLALS